MKVLVTGSEGQLGRALAATAPSDVNLIKRTHKEMDITDEGSVTACCRHYRPTVIINAAAFTDVDHAEREPKLARNINVDGPRRLAAVARKCGARLLHISSDFVFDGASSVPYLPSAATNPLNVYGASKRDGENAVLEVLPDTATVVRTAWLYAASGNNFVNSMLQLMSAKRCVRVVADQVGTPTSARSVAQMLWRLAESPSVTGVHHWTDAGIASWYDFAVAIAEESAEIGLVPSDVTIVPISTREWQSPARRPPFSVLDKTSLMSLGVVPDHWRSSLRQALREIANG